MILFRLFRCPVNIVAATVSLSAAVYSASFAVAETRTQDLFSHLYVCKGRGPRGGARGYVNFSVKIHFVIMDFPCRIHRCRRRCRRPCHDTRHNSSNIHSLSPPHPSHDSDNYLHSPIPPPSRCLMFLGHDRWQVSVGVAPCKFFLGTWESSWHVLKCEGNLQLYPRTPHPATLVTLRVCVRAGVSKILTNTRTQICRFI